MKLKLFKTALYTLIASFAGLGVVNAQEVPIVPPAPPVPPVEFALPAIPPMSNFSDEKWEAFGKKLGKSFEGFDVKMQKLALSKVDFDQKVKEKFENFDQGFKIEIELPVLLMLPKMPEIQAFIPGASYQLGSPDNAIEKVKKSTKTYAVTVNDILDIENSYGIITVNTWDKNEIKVEVEIKAFAENEEDAQKVLDGVSISNSKSDNQIIFKTIIENNNRKNSWMSMSWWNNSGDKQKVEVYYTVYMPSKNALTLKTNYTNVVLPDLNGAVSISMNYGDLTAGKLAGNINKISSNYGKLNLVSLNNAIVYSNYGSFKTEDVDGLNAILNYSNTTLGNLGGNNIIKMNYCGGFKINKLDKDFKSLNINANYSSVNLDLTGVDGFNFEVSTNYASFKYDDLKTKITSIFPEDNAKGYSSSKKYRGVYGKSSNDATIKVISNYGSVKFN
jgi:hypothetical protein